MNLDHLNKEQQSAVTADFGPVLVLAGAGTGKTRVLTNRIAYLIDDLNMQPNKILAMTFTKKAAKEMQDRIEKMIKPAAKHPCVTTIHAFCLQVLIKEVHDLIWLRPGFRVADSYQMKVIMSEVLKRLNKNVDDFIEHQDEFFKYMLKQKTKKLLPNETPIDEDVEWREMYTCLHSLLVAKNLLCFDDMLFYVAKLFDTNKEIASKYQEKFDCVLVDEYQDTSPLQFDIIKTLTDVNKNLYVVGDNDQAIYGFRGADMGIILSFEKNFQNAQTFKLESNYRSVPNIIKAANAIINHNVNRFEKKLIPTEDKYNKIHYDEYTTSYDEACAVAKEIKNLSGETAIIVRNNFMTAAFESVFRQQQIPFMIYGDKPFFSREEVLDVIAYLELIYNDKNYDAFERIANKPSRFIGHVTKTKLIDYCKRYDVGVLAAIRRNPNCIDLNPFQLRALNNFYTLMIKTKLKPDECLIAAVLEDMEYDRYISSISDENLRYNKKLNVMELASMSDRFYKEAKRSLKDFLSYFYFMRDNNVVPDNAVKIMTIHKAKGLEFDNVFVPCVCEKFLPSKYAIVAFLNHNDALMEEERRLFYVAVTRAKTNLYISNYTEGTKFPLTKSRFIDEIPTDTLIIKSDSKYELTEENKQKLLNSIRSSK